MGFGPELAGSLIAIGIWLPRIRNGTRRRQCEQPTCSALEGCLGFLTQFMLRGRAVRRRFLATMAVVVPHKYVTESYSR